MSGARNRNPEVWVGGGDSPCCCGRVRMRGCFARACGRGRLSFGWSRLYIRKGSPGGVGGLVPPRGEHRKYDNKTVIETVAMSQYSHKRRNKLVELGGGDGDLLMSSDPFSSRFIDLTVENENDNDNDDSVFLEDGAAVDDLLVAEPSMFDAGSQGSSGAAALAAGGMSSVRYKKQRTISLPQLPYAKLLYTDMQRNSRGHNSTQSDDELLHLTGNSNITIDSNKLVDLRVVRSVSPSAHPHSIASPIKRRLSSITNKQNHTKYIKTNNSSPGGSGTAVAPPANFQTDKDGHYVYMQNDVFADGRFEVHELLGQGTFGKVLKCSDSYNGNKLLAIKVIKAIDRYREAAKTELRILQTIRANDPQGNYQCILLDECFDYKSHICLVTDLYGRSIYDFMCSNAIAKFPGSQVQAIARQLIRSVCFLHDLGIIHTDLKPENILLVDDKHFLERQLPKEKVSLLSLRRKNASEGGMQKILTNPEIKIIDFGSAIFYNEYHPPIISTRHYRAPEIILGLGWSFPCDIWSIACVLVELVTGESLYPIHENLEHMAMMQRINGLPFPKKLIDKMFYKVSHKLGNLPADLNQTVVKHFNKDTMVLQWPELNKRGDVISTEKSIKRVRDSCDRLDIQISKKLSQDFRGKHALSINWNLSPEQNWNLIKPKLLKSHFQTNNHLNNQANRMMSNFAESYYYPGSMLPSDPFQTSDLEQAQAQSLLNSSKLNPDQVPLDKETFFFWYWFVDLMRKMFEFDPTKRITAKEALEHEWFNLGILDDGITSFENFLN